MMDDKFLYQFQKQPPTEFSERLFEKIANKKGFATQKTWLREVSWGTGILFTMLVFLFGTSPTARAQIEKVIKQIGEMVFYEVEQFPALSPDYNTVTHPIAGHALAVEEIQSQVPFDLAIPTWLPDGFEFVNAVVYEPGLNDDPSSDRTHWSVIIMWQNNSHGIGTMLTLFATFSETMESNTNASNAEIGPSMLVGSGSVEEIEINGLPAAIIHGSWLTNYNCYPCDNPDPLPTPKPSWYDNGQLTLMWIDADVRYELIPDDPFYVPREDLIRIAESMP